MWERQPIENVDILAKLGISIKADVAGIGVPASLISAWYQTIHFRSLYSGTWLGPALALFFIPISELQNAEQSGLMTFNHRWAKLLCSLTVNSLSYFVKIKY
jgi:hypothetical protein